MVLAVSAVNELANDPDPAPFVVLLLDIVGFADVLQQTPLAVTVAPPSLDTFPPLSAEVGVKKDIAVVVIVGNIAGPVVKLISFP